MLCWPKRRVAWCYLGRLAAALQPSCQGRCIVRMGNAQTQEQSAALVAVPCFAAGGGGRSRRTSVEQWVERAPREAGGGAGVAAGSSLPTRPWRGSFRQAMAASLEVDDEGDSTKEIQGKWWV